MRKNEIFDKELSHSCTDYLDDYPNLLCRTKFFFEKSLRFSCWRYLYVHHLGHCMKLIDNMMVNYSEWHTERAPQGKKGNSVKETSSLSDKIDTIMAM
jgi:hypothetical protein